MIEVERFDNEINNEPVFYVHQITHKRASLLKRLRLFTAMAALWFIQQIQVMHWVVSLKINKHSNASVKIRRIDDKAQFHFLLCRDLSELSLYARVDNVAFRLLRRTRRCLHLFSSNKEVPKRLMNAKRQNEIGIRVPDNKIAKTATRSNGRAIDVDVSDSSG